MPAVSSAYELLVEDGYIRVVFRGTQDFATTNRAIADAARMAREKGLRAVMFDFTHADAKRYFTETVRHGEVAAELGFTTDLRTAFYRPTDFDVIDFMETVARNRGYDARAFTSEEQAVRWLRGEGPEVPGGLPPGDG